MSEVFKMIRSTKYSKYNNSIEFSSNFNMLNNQEYFLVSVQQCIRASTIFISHDLRSSSSLIRPL